MPGASYAVGIDRPVKTSCLIQEDSSASAETAVTVRSGRAVIANKTWTGRDATEQERAVVEFLEPWRGRVQCVNVDAIGIGHYLRTALRGYVIQAINFGEEPKNRCKSWAVQCANRKAEMYWRTREILDAGGFQGLDDEMISQAAQVRFFYNLQGRVAIERQRAAANRGISSPDRWESVVLAFGVEPYESLAKSLAFAGYAPPATNGQVAPRDPRDVELERERCSAPEPPSVPEKRRLAICSCLG